MKAIFAIFFFTASFAMAGEVQVKGKPDLTTGLPDLSGNNGCSKGKPTGLPVEDGACATGLPEGEPVMPIISCETQIKAKLATMALTDTTVTSAAGQVLESAEGVEVYNVVVKAEVVPMGVPVLEGEPGGFPVPQASELVVVTQSVGLDACDIIAVVSK